MKWAGLETPKLVAVHERVNLLCINRNGLIGDK